MFSIPLIMPPRKQPPL
jgi:hypothetical protein